MHSRICTGKVNGFNNLEVLIVNFDKHGRVNLEYHVIFLKFRSERKTRDDVKISHQLKRQKHNNNSIFNKNNKTIKLDIEESDEKYERKEVYSLCIKIKIYV